MLQGSVVFCLFFSAAGFSAAKCEIFIRFASACSEKAGSGIQPFRNN